MISLYLHRKRIFSLETFSEMDMSEIWKGNMTFDQDLMTVKELGK